MEINQLSVQSETGHKSTLFDLMWFCYFVVMMNFYTFTYIQLAAQIMVLFSTVVLCATHTSLIGRMKKRLIRYILWYGLFCLWCMLSPQWSVYAVREGSRTLLTIERIFIMGLCIVLQTKDIKSFERIMVSFIHAGLVFACLTILINPVSNWGSTAFCSFGLGFQRNGVANIALYLFCFSVFYSNRLSNRVRRFAKIIFLLLIMMCGSRRAIILLILFIAFYTLTINSTSKRIKNIALITILAIVALFVCYNIPFLRDTYIQRISEMFMGESSTDASTVGRLGYVTVGWEMFLDRPLKGWGLEGFSRYLFYHPYAISDTAVNQAVYSHNNYIELLSCLGAVGFVLFYNMHLELLLRNIKKVMKSDKSRMVIICLVLILIGDYGTIIFNAHVSFYIVLFLVCINDLYREKR